MTFSAMTFLGAMTAVSPHPVSILPFVLILLAIAVMPFVNLHWWERNYHIVAVVLGTLTIGYYVLVLGAGTRMLHVAHEYISFVALIGSLYVITGGIHIQVKGQARPLGNCVYLLIGAVLANIIGTTGASMLLIRPWIRMNRYRVTAFHIAFFIFIVSNVGGCLTPVGDPPLFLGYLRGVPFWWVAEHCFSAWAIAVGALLAVFFVIDTRNFRRAPKGVRNSETAHETWNFRGAVNVCFLVVVLVSVFIKNPAGLREALLIAAAAGSFFATKRDIHQANDFNFHPIKEVAWLFLGIFATMVPALDYLQVHARQLGLESQMQYYWFTGALAAVLDNAPTYLTLLAAALGAEGLSLDSPADVQTYAFSHEYQLMAISIGAVFFGAMTYIGNGPNFMVKAIADQQKVKLPSFIGFVVRFSLPILLPILFVIGLLFFSRWRIF